jgi:hypothetical protein
MKLQIARIAITARIAIIERAISNWIGGAPAWFSSRRAQRNTINSLQ